MMKRPELDEVKKSQHVETGGEAAHGIATVSMQWKAQVKRNDYAKRILQAWAATKKKTGTGREMDALLMPCTPWPASPK